MKMEKPNNKLYLWLGIIFIALSTWLYPIMVSSSAHIISGVCWVWSYFTFYLPFNWLSFIVFPVKEAIWSRNIFAIIIAGVSYGLVFYFYFKLIKKRQNTNNLLIYLPYILIILLYLVFTFSYCSDI